MGDGWLKTAAITLWVVGCGMIAVLAYDSQLWVLSFSFAIYAGAITVSLMAFSRSLSRHTRRAFWYSHEFVVDEKQFASNVTPLRPHA